MTLMCLLFGHLTIPYRKHHQEVGALDGVHLYGWYCTRCKEQVARDDR